MVNYRLYLRQWVFLTLVFLLVIQKVHGQEKIVSPPPAVGIKTNLLYDATSTLNLGVEFRTGRRTSFDMSANWNPFSFSDNRKWKHLLIQPEFRYWTKETFSGHFLGLHAHYAYWPSKFHFFRLYGDTPLPGLACRSGAFIRLSLELYP